MLENVAAVTNSLATLRFMHLDVVIAGFLVMMLLDNLFG